jgi:hypothetical protein
MSRKNVLQLAIGGIAVVALIVVYEIFFTRNFARLYPYCPTRDCVVVVTPAPSGCTLNPSGVRLHPQDTLQFVYPPGVTGSYHVHFNHNTFPVNDFPVGYPKQTPNRCSIILFGCNDTYTLDPACGVGPYIGVHVDH